MVRAGSEGLTFLFPLYAKRERLKKCYIFTGVAFLHSRTIGYKTKRNNENIKVWRRQQLADSEAIDIVSPTVSLRQSATSRVVPCDLNMTHSSIRRVPDTVWRRKAQMRCCKCRTLYTARLGEKKIHLTTHQGDENVPAKLPCTDSFHVSSLSSVPTRE